MFRLSSDESLHFELLRQLSGARYFGADINEVLQVAGRIDKTNLESFHDAFAALAEKVYRQAEAIDSSHHPVSARDFYFRAATYFRAADFYLHGNPSDPRILALWEKQTAAFDKALPLMETPGKRITLAADGFQVPAIFYAAPGDPSTPKPTFIAGSGYDGSQEELLHQAGYAALERGYNFISYEGPGQPSVRRYQSLGFIAEWEKVVTPVIDYLETRPEVDKSKIALLGVSMGGWLCVRAAAFEHRLAAVIANDGVYDVYEAFLNMMPGPIRQLLEAGEREKTDEMVKGALSSGKLPVGVRWGIEQGLWTFTTDSPYDYLMATKKMTLEGLTDKIKCPVFVGKAADDQFFQGQPERMRDELGDKATFVTFTSEDAAGNHCHEGAKVVFNQASFDWLDDVLAK